MKVGAACPHGCVLSGVEVGVIAETGTQLGGGRLGSVVWPGAEALFWTELRFDAPSASGSFSWLVGVVSTSLGVRHECAPSRVGVIVTPPLEHSVTLTVVEGHSGTTVEGAEIRVGAFRARTNHDGVASLTVPTGAYDLHVWKPGYEMLSRTSEVRGTLDMHFELQMLPQADQPYWM